MSKCENCKKYEDCKDGAGGGFCWPCGAYRPAVTTNADRIRAMSDEELAKAIVEWQKTDPSIKWCRDDYGCAALGEDFDCTDELQAGCILRWLSQPAEED